MPRDYYNQFDEDSNNLIKQISDDYGRDRAPTSEELESIYGNLDDEEDDETQEENKR